MTQQCPLPNPFFFLLLILSHPLFPVSDSCVVVSSLGGQTIEPEAFNGQNVCVRSWMSSLFCTHRTKNRLLEAKMRKVEGRKKVKRAEKTRMEKVMDRKG